MKFLGILMMVICYGNSASEAPDLEKYFYHLKNLQFQRANEIAATLKDKELQMSVKQLTKILKNKDPLVSLPNSDSSSMENQFVKLLISGYQELYSENISTIKVYKDFTASINLAEELNQDYLVKAALRAMLDLLSREIFIGSRQFEPYLEYLKEKKTDSTDDIIITFYEIIFYSKADESLNVSSFYNEAVAKLDSIFSLIAETHPFYPYYLHEKGIQKKIAQNFHESEEFFKKTEILCLNKPLYDDLYGTTLWQMADLMQLSGNFEEAKVLLEKYKKTSKSLRDIFYHDRLKATVLKHEKDADSAYYFLLKSVNLEYQLGYKNNSLESSILAVQNETDKLKLNTIRLDNKRRQNRNWLIAASLALIFGAGIAILLQKNTTKKRQLAEKEALLKQERVDNLLKEQELLSIDAMIEGQEKERQRVANELHDDLGSLMATIKLHFDNSKVSKKDPALQNAQKLLEEAYQKVRGMAHSKNSGVMSNQGLLPAIKKMAQVITETNALEVIIEDFGMGDRLENSLELNLFRMVQELVANAIKHADATKVNIQLTQHEDNLNIIIEDDGKGFDRTKVDSSKTGMGLTTIEKRVEHLEGNFTVDSVLGKGTSILIDIPV